MMSAQELLDWQVLEKIDPWGQLRDDHRFAMLASTIANSQGVKKEDGTLYGPEDFLLKFEQPKPPPVQDPASMEAMFRMAVAANNAFWEKKERLTPQ